MKCLQCQKELIQPHGKRKYCSPKCRNYRFTVFYKKECLSCLKEYLGRKGQKFCSQPCYRKHRWNLD